MQNSNLPFLVEDAVAVVRESAQLALGFVGKIAPDVKADNTLVTEADRQVELFLRDKLGQLAPDWSFLGEEGGLVGDPNAPCWVIDPIDGTTNFVRGLPLWCVSVGAVFDGNAIFGCIAVPPLDEMFWASIGSGAWRQSSTRSAVALHVFDSDSLMQEDLIACNTTAETAVNFEGVSCRARNFGSLTYHMAALAQGALVGSVARQHQLHDIAAGMCICHEAGCVSRFLDGAEWRAEVTTTREKRPLITAPPQILAQLLVGFQK